MDTNSRTIAPARVIPWDEMSIRQKRDHLIHAHGYDHLPPRSDAMHLALHNAPIYGTVWEDMTVTERNAVQVLAYRPQPEGIPHAHDKPA